MQVRELADGLSPRVSIMGQGGQWSLELVMISEQQGAIR